MKANKLILAIAVTCSALLFSACADEEESVIPMPQDSDQVLNTGGTETIDFEPE